MVTKTYDFNITNFSECGNRGTGASKAPGINGETWVKIKNKTENTISINVRCGLTPNKDTFLYLYRENDQNCFASNDDSGENGESLCNNVFLQSGETIYAWCSLYSEDTSDCPNTSVNFEISHLKTVDDVTILKYNETEMIRVNPTLELFEQKGKTAKLKLTDKSEGYLLKYDIYVETNNQPKTLIDSFSNNNQVVDKIVECGIGMISCFLQNEKDYKFTVECYGDVSTEVKTSEVTFKVKSEEPVIILENAKIFLEESKLKTKIKISFDLNDYKNLLTENKIQIFDFNNNEIFNDTITFLPKDFTDKFSSVNIYPLVFTSNHFVVKNNIAEIYIEIEKNKTYKLIKNSKDIQFLTEENDTITDFNLITYPERIYENIYVTGTIPDIKILDIVKAKTAKILKLKTLFDENVLNLIEGFELFFETKINDEIKYLGKKEICEFILGSNTTYNICCKILACSDNINYFEIEKKEFAEVMPKLNKPSIEVTNIKSYANKIEYSEMFNELDEPNVVFDIMRSEIEDEETEEESAISESNIEKYFLDKKTKSGKIYKYRVKSKDIDNPSEEIYSDYVTIKNKLLLHTFEDNNIQEKTKYYYKVISVKNKYMGG